MTCKNEGDLAAAAIVDSHDHEQDHATIGIMGDADAESEAEECCGDQEPFFQCVDDREDCSVADAVVPANDDARTEFPDGEEDEEGDDVRHSFATAVDEQIDLDRDEEEEEEEEEDTSRYDYDMWMEEPEPMSIQERRRRLLHGMGLTSSRDLLCSRNARPRLPPDIPRGAPPRRQPQPPADVAPPSTSATAPAGASPLPETTLRHQQARNAALTRCRSDSRLPVRGGGGVRRKPEPPTTFRRVSSLPHSLHGSRSPVHNANRTAVRRSPSASSGASKHDRNGNGSDKKNQDKGNGKEEFVANGKESNGQQGGVQVRADEFERFIGYTPLLTQLMRHSQSQPVPAASAPAKDGGEKQPALKRRTRWLKKVKLVASAAGLIVNEKDKDGTGGGGSSTSSSSTPAAATMMSKSASAHAALPLSSSGGGGPERLKVNHYGKSSKELTGLYVRQELRAHEGSIWTMKFSPDARFLATGGEDHVVRVWRVVVDAVAQELPSAAAPPMGLAAQLSMKVRRGRSGKDDVLPEQVVVPESLFALAEQPACAFEGHHDDVLDLSWSKSQRLLSSSMDKTVRLWDMDTQTCLKLFAHNDYVTCVQFNPTDDGYFISGSLDSKVRIWSVPERQVVDWSDLNDMVTAACYTPDGQAAIIGSHKGSCRFYKTTDCKLNQEAQIDMSISKKRKSQAKKITGFQFAPGNPSEILVTSADSQIRVFNGITVLQKFKGFKNTSSQISASYTADGRYVVCASEDSHVYLWRRAPGAGTAGSVAGGGIGVRAKTWLTSRSYEYFFCRDVSVAVPWPGSPSSSSARCAAGSTRSSSVHGGGRRDGGDADGGGAPPRPKSGPMTYSPGRKLPEPDLSSREPSARWHGGAEGGNAWGLVVVTASRGGEIRVYQNFGLPLGVKGQSNLFSTR